ncbi:hypothetical protein immuto35A_125 [Flavobacterium phage vB_FspM_immuto_3-5A]|uniref:Uncharacterized protein n=1 Tax=Flavobacterium phage vB_FspM_immuto_2-6A TaxID=2801477 RepID=A0A7T8ERK1_9CAUD|nr:hypothetical protein KNV73_gp145 [Flavobacterium phage vB_FspM_immuto_2-6A]QQO91805.1 hypothetical protein immuto26A_126 [Flavobacterium phage vB_FspM_immuto_2-6A]QQO92043.1 hypothetical protein immuto35A_125 [Flavobacterium phage vB_FspM_immuto_3-5A]QQO92281.1 hypothetical protein immuto136C_125 [Flavobacterium phage vB_FspM_immuto_13-6C]
MTKIKKSEKFQVLSNSANNKILLALFADNGRELTEREQYLVIESKSGYQYDIRIGLNEELGLSLLTTSYSRLELDLSELKILIQFLEQKSLLQN